MVDIAIETSSCSYARAQVEDDDDEEEEVAGIIVLWHKFTRDVSTQPYPRLSSLSVDSEKPEILADLDDAVWRDFLIDAKDAFSANFSVWKKGGLLLLLLLVLLSLTFLLAPFDGDSSTFWWLKFYLIYGLLFLAIEPIHLLLQFVVIFRPIDRAMLKVAERWNPTFQEQGSCSVEYVKEDIVHRKCSWEQLCLLKFQRKGQQGDML